MPAYTEMPPVSKGEINRCGEHLAQLHRLAVAGDFEGHDEELRKGLYWEANRIVDQYRAAHQKPLSITSVGLRQFVTSALGTAPAVSQRLKRLPRIVRKLANMEKSNLARLEDIGGTRAVVDSLADQERLVAHIKRRWGNDIRRARDYVAEPKASGYRAHHIVVQKHDLRIEIQVRTRQQQRWANFIEETDSRLGIQLEGDVGLKDGVGPPSLLAYTRTLGAMLYHVEAESTPSVELNREFQDATDAVIDEGFFVRRKERD